ncbi:MAG: ABC transporter permease [Vicinamibacterales bacterium]|nr:ABC transporter permease [Vicinamibacterales bacterium]
MSIPFELHIALRYLMARRYSVVSILGVAVGVMALVIALALMTGLQTELRDRILGATAHVFVWKQSGLANYEAEVAEIRKIPHVKGAAPAILGKAMVSSPSGTTFISLKGIDPVLEADVSELEKGVTSGKLADLNTASDEALDGIFLGKDLAQTLAVSVGDRVEVTTPHGTLGPGGMMFRPRPLRVAGIYFMNLYEYDATFGFVSLPVAERLTNRSEPELIELTVDDIDLAPQVASAITATLGPQYITQDWTTMNRSLFEALWLEKMAISITISLIVIVAALNIVGSLVLLVMEKRSDIAILKTMGASSMAVMYVFMLQGLIIGVTGTVVGAATGMTLSWVLDHYRLIRVSGDVYQISYLPFTLLPFDFVIVVLVAVLICFIATIYPSRQAARLKPVEALRYG